MLLNLKPEGKLGIKQSGEKEFPERAGDEAGDKGCTKSLTNLFFLEKVLKNFKREVTKLN